MPDVYTTAVLAKVEDWLFNSHTKAQREAKAQAIMHLLASGESVTEPSIQARHNYSPEARAKVGA
jgi:hypothetical protein